MIDSIKTDSPDALQEHFRFRPKRIAVDPVERLYVTVEGVFDGLMVLNLEGSSGFMGARGVSAPWRSSGTRWLPKNKGQGCSFAAHRVQRHGLG